MPDCEGESKADSDVMAEMTPSETLEPSRLRESLSSVDTTVTPSIPTVVDGTETLESPAAACNQNTQNQQKQQQYDLPGAIAVE
eukprot:scaffold50122_cov35-Cyclotella_meneghiniana.AAC.1